MGSSDSLGGSCPVPLMRSEQVLAAHGGGGKLTADLLTRIFRPHFSNPLLDQEHDGAVFSAPASRLAFTADGYVVQPLFFPGGNIGTLAIHGTANDLAMCGARPMYFSACFVLEEGLSLQVLEQVVESMGQAARAIGVQIVAGDTKVVERSHGTGLHLAMSGIGAIEHSLAIEPSSVRGEDVVILSGDIGRHGIAVLAARQQLDFQGALPSDCAPLYAPVAALLEAGIEIHCLRDLTRGGLAAAIVEIAGKAGLAIEIDERLIPVAPAVRGACELLGLDPVHVACEGRFIVFVPPSNVEQALAVLHSQSVSADARVIGRVAAGSAGQTTRITPVGSRRMLDLPTGEQLPRIC